MTRKTHHSHIKAVTFTPTAPRPVHPRMARTAEQIAQLDDQSVMLRYRQLSARMDMAGRGDAAELTKRDLFATEARKRNLI